MIDTVEFPKLGLEFTINRAAFYIGDFAIYWYAVCIITGVFLAILYASKHAKGVGLDPDRMFDVIMVGFVGAIIGARGFYVLFKLEDYDSFLEVVNMRDGGLAIYGGIIGAVLFAWIMAKIRKLRFTPLLDLTGIGFLIGQGLGRWGNFFNREAFGSNTELPWGMTSTDISNYLSRNKSTILEATGVTVDPDMLVHPTFLYESLWCLLGFVLLHLYLKRRKFDGEVFLLYIGWYGAGRFVFEGLRTDSLMLGSLRISQLIAGLCVAFALIAVFIIRSRIKRSGEYVFYKDTEESKMLIEKYEESLKKNKKQPHTEDAQNASDDETLADTQPSEAEAENEEDNAEQAESETPNLTDMEDSDDTKSEDN